MYQAMYFFSYETGCADDRTDVDVPVECPRCGWTGTVSADVPKIEEPCPECGTELDERIPF